jgi:hypothetical protein
MVEKCYFCGGGGWLLSWTEYDVEIQRCDVCQKFKGDLSAWGRVRAAVLHAAQGKKLSKGEVLALETLGRVITKTLRPMKGKSAEKAGDR